VIQNFNLCLVQYHSSFKVEVAHHLGALAPMVVGRLAGQLGLQEDVVWHEDGSADASKHRDVAGIQSLQCEVRAGIRQYAPRRIFGGFSARTAVSDRIGLAGAWRLDKD
jgi:hypothetical protein